MANIFARQQRGKSAFGKPPSRLEKINAKTVCLGLEWRTILQRIPAEHPEPYFDSCFALQVQTPLLSLFDFTEPSVSLMVADLQSTRSA